MTVVKRTWNLDPDEVAELRQPRTDLVEEVADGTDRWTMVEGPFNHYQRTIQVAEKASPDGRFEVNEETDYKLAIPYWWLYLGWPMRRAIGSRNRTPHRRWWWPREVVSAETANLIGLLATIGAMAGFMGVLIGQTITFAAADFGANDADQANTLAFVRVGVLVSMVLIARADSSGRRPLILWFTLAAILLTVVGAATPSLVALGGSQALARGLNTGLITLITLASTEQVPASARAMSIGFMYLATGAGAAVVVWVLPLAGVSNGGWRLIYLIPLLFLPILWHVARNMPETRRFQRAEAASAPGDIPWGRFALVAGTAFIAAIFLSPASQLQNEFLSDDQGFSPTEISGFRLLISIPSALAVPVGGYLADRFNRRWVGSISLAVAAIATAISYQVTGWQLWVSASIGFTTAAAAVPALRGYQTELFPTRARARVGGFIDVLAVSGSAIGLVTVGWLAVRWDDLGRAVGSMVWAPLLVALAILFFFPETAGKELEELNPTDPAIDAT